ncbi:MAG: c-type cytochrome [Pseudomonadota bacterium]
MKRSASLLLVLALAGCGERPLPAGIQGNPERGRVALTQYACRACHMIPGVTGSEVYVGRPLGGLAARPFIAGALPNTQENLVRWIRDPKAVDPLTAMPALDVTEADARDMAAYLLTLR